MNNSYILTFLGTTPNIGTTLITLTSAVRIAEHSRKRVALLCFNLKSSKLHRYIGIGENRASLDELLPHLRNGSFNEFMLEHAMHKYDDASELYLLFGNRYRETAEYYGVEELTLLIQTACKRYDYVLLDSNAYWDNAATICSLLEANGIVMTTTTALSHFQEDYVSWAGVMGEHIQLQHKKLFTSVIQGPGGLYQPKHCYSQLAGQKLPPITLPISLYEALDRGNFKLWLKENKDGRKWLANYVDAIIPMQRQQHKAIRSNEQLSKQYSALSLLFKQKREQRGELR